jgi:uncharacterized protein (DUF4415 family)
MSENNSPWETVLDLDDAPDLSEPYWAERLAKAKVRRGRPKADATKISTTLRLDAEVLEAFKNDGAGWQSRINATLRKAVGL